MYYFQFSRYYQSIIVIISWCQCKDFRFVCPSATPTEKLSRRWQESGFVKEDKEEEDNNNNNKKKNTVHN
jgi:hypothetical protein